MSKTQKTPIIQIPKDFVYNPEKWGPPYWFFLHTIALTYPLYPNSITKKKYYEFIQNFSLFIPNEEIATYWKELIDSHPVTPYLDNRDSFVTWIHYIHNQVNMKMEKPQVSLFYMLAAYYKQYESVSQKMVRWNKLKGQITYFCILFTILTIAYFLYKLG